MTDVTPAEQRKPDENRSALIWKAVAVVLAVLLILTGGMLLLSGGVPALSGSSSGGGSGVGLVVDPNAAEYVGQVVNTTPEPGVKVLGFAKWTIPPYKKENLNIELHNPAANEGLYYQTYKLCLLDENGEVSEVLYESQLVPPNSIITKIDISRGLPAGEYDAVLIVQPYRIADMSPTNNANLKLTIIVK